MTCLIKEPVNLLSDILGIVLIGTNGRFLRVHPVAFVVAQPEEPKYQRGIPDIGFPDVLQDEIGSDEIQRQSIDSIPYLP